MPKARRTKEIDPDEIFLDSSNLPSFDTQQFEGRIEKPISKRTIFSIGIFIVAVQIIFITKIWSLQIERGNYFFDRSQRNSLKQADVFAERGIIYDRNNLELAWNTPEGRTYLPESGTSHVLGYVGYPTEQEIASSSYNPKEFIGRDGLEKLFNNRLIGQKGSKIVEVDALGSIISESVYHTGQKGSSLVLSIDSLVNKKLYQLVKDFVQERKFEAGAAVLMDVRTGEILAITSYPDFDPGVLSKGKDSTTITSYLQNKKSPFLNRAISGLYSPGSVVKPVVAVGVLEEGIISPEKKILSTGSISLPNPFEPGKFSVFKDWRAHGWVDLRKAIAVSSDIYFYTVGGGFEGQKGIGIYNIDKYAKLFGLGQNTGVEVDDEEGGVIPSPEWKAENFNGSRWLVGDTYNTVIGQYGFLVTPLQMARAMAAIANNGVLLKPTLLKKKEMANDVQSSSYLGIDQNNLKIVKEGMRMTVTEGTATNLNIEGLTVAAKTGSAQVGVSKSKLNAWIVGFFPYERPRYSFVVVMEKGSVDNNSGAALVIRQLLLWMKDNNMAYVLLDNDK